VLLQKYIGIALYQRCRVNAAEDGESAQLLDLRSMKDSLCCKNGNFFA
jgi:hypothetical protein